MMNEDAQRVWLFRGNHIRAENERRRAIDDAPRPIQVAQ